MSARLVPILGLLAVFFAGTAAMAQSQDRRNVVVVQVGPSWPSGGTLALTGWIEGVDYRRQLRQGLDASINYRSLFEWPVKGASPGDRKGRGLSSAGSLYHFGLRAVRGRGRSRVYYGGGPSIARYPSQVGAFGAPCPTCGRRSGAGLFGIAGVERRLATKLARVDVVYAVEATMDRVWTSGLVDGREQKTTDTWTALTFNVGFAW